jgi:hypothetical protein
MPSDIKEDCLERNIPRIPSDIKGSYSTNITFPGFTLILKRVNIPKLHSQDSL